MRRRVLWPCALLGMLLMSSASLLGQGRDPGGWGSPSKSTAVATTTKSGWGAEAPKKVPTPKPANATKASKTPAAQPVHLGWPDVTIKTNGSWPAAVVAAPHVVPVPAIETALKQAPPAPKPAPLAPKQAPPAEPAKPDSAARPDDTPSIKVGATVFTDFTYTQAPKTTDADGNAINMSQFNVGRTYLNITGNVSHIAAFRITQDIAREGGSGSSLNGSLTYRLKYAYAQFNLDDWMGKGSWVRLGIQQTPWIDLVEGVYRYRFQGTVFSEREGFLSSSDAGVSFHYALPSNYGDVHVGAYNGESYGKPEVNNQKALQMRGTLRPMPTGPKALRGLRATIFYDRDRYVAAAERTRLIGAVTFEHPYLNAGFEYLKTHDQTSSIKAQLEGSGFSIFATPRSKQGFEGLFRYDQFTPNTSLDAQRHRRTIAGVSYWLPHQGAVSSAIMLDYDHAWFPGYTPAQPAQTKIALHGLVIF